MPINTLVYRDVRYPTGWLSGQLPDQISRWLTQDGFRRVDADELRSEMLGAIPQKGPAALVVFAQDVAPDTVFDDVSGSALARRYLDCGGSIVWLGDVPFFHRGLSNGGQEEVWSSGAASAILGVVPFVACFPREATKLTCWGKRLGLATAWTGTRPVMQDKGVRPLACSGYLSAHPYLPYPPPEPWYRRLAGHMQIGPAPSLQLDLAQAPVVGVAPEWWYRACLTNAWFKNFCRQKKKTGFYRLWDTNGVERVAAQDEFIRVIGRIRATLRDV